MREQLKKLTMASPAPRDPPKSATTSGHPAQTDIVDTSPVHWQPVDSVPPSFYINYSNTIKIERMPDLFPPGPGKTNVSKLYSLPVASALALSNSSLFYKDWDGMKHLNDTQHPPSISHPHSDCS